MEDEYSMDEFTEDKTHLTEMVHNNWKEWLEEIENELEKESKRETDRPNAYCNIRFTKILKKDILLLPLWTKLLETKTDCGYVRGFTASCEGEINKIKNIVFKDIKNKTIRIDSFVQKHIEHLFGEMLLTDSNLKVDQHELNETSLRESQDLQERENWKGKIIKQFKIPKTNFNDNCSMFIDDKENIKEKKSETDTMEIDTSPMIKILKNEENEQNILKDISNKS